MTSRRDGISLVAVRLWAVLSATALALAWAGEARAGCGGLAHPASDDLAATAGMLSAEITGDDSPTPLRPTGCAGAFCAKTDGSAGMDFTGGVDLRADNWACVAPFFAPDRDGGVRLVSRSDVARPATVGNELLDPPR